jgi:hypothetical protein
MTDVAFNQIVIDHRDGESVDVDPDPTTLEAIQNSSHLELLTIPHDDIYHETMHPTLGLEGGAVKRAATNIIRKGTLLGASLPGMAMGMRKSGEPALTKEQKEERMKEKLEREKFIRKEQHFSNREGQRPIPRAAGASSSLPKPKRSWVEGSQLVTESADGEQVEITHLSPIERESRITKHVDALKKLGIDVGSEFKRRTKPSVSPPPLVAPEMMSRESLRTIVPSEVKGKAVEEREEGDGEGRTKLGSIGMERTERIKDPDDEETESSDDSTPPRPAASPPPPLSTTRQRSNSAIRSMRDLLTKRHRSPTPTTTSLPPPSTSSLPATMPPASSTGDLTTTNNRGRTTTASSSRFGSRASSPARSIKFVDNKPPTRSIPPVGSNLGMRRVPTAEALGMRNVPSQTNEMMMPGLRRVQTGETLGLRRVPTGEATAIRFVDGA